MTIHGKNWGVLRVGVSLRALQERLRELALHVALFAGTFLLGGVAIFYLVGRALARPLQGLSERIEAVGEALPEPPPPSRRRDEIGSLERSYAGMIERLRKSEGERETALRRLLENERLVAAGQIVAGVAHEVNNPLAAIEGALFHVQQKPDEPENRYFQVIRQGMERIGGVVAQLRDLSRSGEVNMQPVEIGKIYEDAALFAKMAFKRKGVSLEVTEPPPNGTAVLDPPKIHQALLNLFVNAADSAGEGGVVRFACSVRGDDLVFEVQDDGPGVPDEIRERIFEPFFTTKPAGQGSGMGLAISRRIVEGHGGTLALETREQGGARFILRLPSALQGRENR